MGILDFLNLLLILWFIDKFSSFFGFLVGSQQRENGVKALQVIQVLAGHARNFCESGYQPPRHCSSSDRQAKRHLAFYSFPTAVQRHWAFLGVVELNCSKHIIRTLSKESGCVLVPAIAPNGEIRVESRRFGEPLC